MSDEVLDDIRYWWEGAQSHVELEPAEEKKLCEAFVSILRKIPNEALERFLPEQPVVICSAYPAQCMRYTVPVLPDQEPAINIIYICPSSLSDGRLIDYVAHEIAHIIRGDHKFKVAQSETPKIEKAADDLSELWGFNRISK